MLTPRTEEQPMKYGLSQTLGLIGLVVVSVTCAVTPAPAETIANGPYYATPSWDQQLPASIRFIVLANWNNEAVLDRETGLVWQRSPTGFHVPWRAATNACIDQRTGNRFGWRLPTVN